MEMHQLATFASLLLILWEVMRKSIPGAILSMAVMLGIVFVANTTGYVVSALLAVPIAIEERWHRRANKDLIRGVLAAAIIASSAGLILFG